jgi:hypothetical protein
MLSGIAIMHKLSQQTEVDIKVPPHMYCSILEYASAFALIFYILALF